MSGGILLSMPDTPAQRKARTADRIARGMCVNCGGRPSTRGTQRCDPCAGAMQRRSTAYYERTREAAFQAYGGWRCACCGETEHAFLSIDHVNDDGAAERRAMVDNEGSNNFYVWLKRQGYPAGYQVLCQNCNVGRYRNGGVCPHQTGGAACAPKSA